MRLTQPCCLFLPAGSHSWRALLLIRVLQGHETQNAQCPPTLCPRSRACMCGWFSFYCQGQLFKNKTQTLQTICHCAEKQGSWELWEKSPNASICSNITVVPVIPDFTKAAFLMLKYSMLLNWCPRLYKGMVSNLLLAHAVYRRWVILLARSAAFCAKLLESQMTFN